jgi:heat shock protein HslJ
VGGPKPYIAFSGGIIKGSPGCGQFTGTYHRSGDQLAISAKWADDKRLPCNDGGKDAAAEILQALGNVRLIKPEYDGLFLENEYRELRVRLAPMQPGKDLSELHDTFWKLNQLEGSAVGLSNAIVNIEESQITLSTPAYSAFSPFQHMLTGPKFQISQPDSPYIETLQPTDRQVVNAFENSLQKIASYETQQSTLTFYDKDRHPLFILNPIQSTGIENRQWRIARYRGYDSPQADKEGLIDTKYDASIVFSNGRVKGSPGGGMWGGTYKLSGDELAFDGGFWYEGAWSGDQLDQGYAVSKAFKGDRRIEHRGDQILLRDKSGQAQILLVAR